MKTINCVVLLAALHCFITTGQSQSIIPELKICKGRSQSLQCMQPDATSPGNKNYREISFYKTGTPDVLVAFWSVSPGHAVVTDQHQATWEVSKTSLGLALTVTPVDKDSVVGMYRCEFSNSKITYGYITLTWDETCTKVDNLEANIEKFSESLETLGTKEGKPSFIAIVSLVFVIIVAFVLIGGILYYFLIREKKKPQRVCFPCCKKKDEKKSKEDVELATHLLSKSSASTDKLNTGNNPEESNVTPTHAEIHSNVQGQPTTRSASSNENLIVVEEQGQKPGSLQPQAPGHDPSETTPGGDTNTPGDQKQTTEKDKKAEKKKKEEEEKEKKKKEKEEEKEKEKEKKKGKCVMS